MPESPKKPLDIACFSRLVSLVTFDFRILGPLEVEGDSGPLALGGQRQRALLAVLLLHAGRVVPTDRLIHELWGDHPPASAANSLQNAVSQLRKVLGPETLQTRAPGYVLVVKNSSIDVGRFESALSDARRAPPAGTCSALAPGAGYVARASAGGVHVRVLRAERDPPARGAAPRRDGAAHRGGYRERAARRRRARAPRARRGASAAGDVLAAIDACALPRRATGRGARRVSVGARAARGRARHRAERGAASAARLDSASGRRPAAGPEAAPRPTWTRRFSGPFSPGRSCRSSGSMAPASWRSTSRRPSACRTTGRSISRASPST